MEKKSSIIAIGLTIHNTPVDVREKLAIPEVGCNRKQCMHRTLMTPFTPHILKLLLVLLQQSALMHCWSRRQNGLEP